MELRRVLAVVGRSWLILVVTLVVALGVGALVLKVVPATYETETKVLLAPNVPADAATSVVQAGTVVLAQAPTYAALVDTSSVLDPAIKSSGVAVSSADLADDVSASLAPQTSVITITVDADSADHAATLANAVAASLIAQVKSVSATGGVGVTGSVVEAPVVPTGAASPTVLLTFAVALAVGLAVAFVVIAFRQALRAPAPAPA